MKFSVRRIAVWLGFILAAALLAGCDSKPAFTNLDITGNTQFGSDFSLPDTSGKPRTLGDFKGKAVVLFFGYTHCPDVCPTTLAELSQAIAKLGDDGKRAQVLMVTVDPARDTAAALHDYVRAFDARHTVGLTGTNGAIEGIAKRYRVAYQMEKRDPSGAYDVTHSSAVYIFDTHGHARLLATESDSIDTITHDLRRVIDSTGS